MAAAQRKSRSGQALLIFGVMSIVMIGFVGIVADGGMAFVERRKAQSAADLIARAGSMAKANGSSAYDADVLKAMSAAAVANGYAATAVTMQYTDTTGSNVAYVGAGGISTAVGVRATVNHQFNSYFRNLLNLGTSQVTATAAFGAAGISSIDGMGESPFVMCAASAWQVSPTNTSNVALLTYSGGAWTIDSSKIGYTFRVHSSQLANNGDAECGNGNQFKGNASVGDGNCAAIPCDWATSNGTQAGPARTRVANATGCTDTDSSHDDCLLVIPLGIRESHANAPAACTDTSSSMCVVAFGLFSINNCGSNCHEATLLDGSKYNVLSGSTGSGAPSLSSCSACPRAVIAIE